MAGESRVISRRAPSAIAGRRAVTFGAADHDVAQASAVSDTLIGISERIGSRDAQGMCDVVIQGIAEAEAGGNITRGDALTTAADGRLIAVSAGTDSVVGIAMVSAVAGDYFDVLIAQG